MGDALDLVTFDDEAAPAVEYALSGTLVAGTLEEAVAIVRGWRDRAGFRRVVTLEGDVVEAGGVITGGTREGQAEGLLSRVRELALLRKKLEEAEEAYGKVRRREEELRRRFSTADQSLVAQRGQADEAKQELERRRLEAESLTGELKRLDEALERSRARRGEVEAELARLEPLPDEEAASPEEETALREEHSSALALVDRLSAERGPLRDALEQERLAKGRLQSRLEALAGEIERGERDLSALDAQSGSLRDELAGLEQEADEADADLDELSTVVARLTLDQDGEEEKLQGLRRRVNEIT
ncbi:MAG TPA: hypothetical protein ENN88_04420, partial [Candidatus Coatesbacteria bacterium]|nr:hypothetical protein [Candidatus Coatesbacteria bacterium]